MKNNYFFGINNKNYFKLIINLHLLLVSFVQNIFFSYIIRMNFSISSYDFFEKKNILNNRIIMIKVSFLSVLLVTIAFLV